MTTRATPGETRALAKIANADRDRLAGLVLDLRAQLKSSRERNRHETNMHRRAQELWAKSLIRQEAKDASHAGELAAARQRYRDERLKASHAASHFAAREATLREALEEIGDAVCGAADAAENDDREGFPPRVEPLETALRTIGKVLARALAAPGTPGREGT